MKFFKSIRFRLTLWYVIVIVALLACFGVAAYIMLSYQLHRNLDESLRSKALEVESGLRFEAGQLTILGQPSELVMVHDADGALVRRLGPNVAFNQVDRFVKLALLGQPQFFSETTSEGLEVRFYATAFTIPPDSRVAIVVGKPPVEIESVLSTVKSIFSLSAFFAVVLAAFGGSVLTNRAFYPVLRMTGAAEDIGEANLAGRIEVHSEDELGRLASTLNRMMGRIELAFNRQRQFAADASHELRTPLSVIQAESTLALGKDRSADEYRKSLEVVSQEVDYMTTMLGNLLLMARSEAGKEPFHFEKVNLKELMIELSPSVELRAKDKGLEFDLSSLDDLTVDGDRVKLRQLFTNILDNAVRYTPVGGSVSVTFASREGFAVVNITDTGIGIAEEQLPFIFERFYRVDKARSRAEGGAGLGLGIAKHIAESHGGRIEVVSRVGKGSTFRVYLPLAEPGT
jgi:heavy metal sensor kinase